MSRNKDRMGTSGAGNYENTETPPQMINQNNNENPFSFIVPTEFVELPSRGLFYPEGHPLHNQSTIEIKQMTAKEEDILTSRALLKQGLAIDRLISSIILNKRVNASELLVGDRNAILIAARVSGYGNTYETNVTCPACSETNKHVFDLNGLQVYNGDGIDPSEITNNEDGTFNTTLPRSGVEVTFRLLSGRDEKQLLAQAETARKKKGNENSVTRQLKQLVVAVNGDTQHKNIKYVVDNMPSSDARHLRLMYKIATPNIDMSQIFECESCGHEEDMEVPLTADFFWPDR